MGEEANSQAKFMQVARAVFDKVDAQLNEDTYLAAVFNFLKDKTGLKRSYFLSAIAAIVLLVVAEVAQLTWDCIGGLYGFAKLCGYLLTVLYPAASSVKVLATQHQPGIQQWLTYWSCLSVLGTLQLFLPPLHYLLEYYPTLKMIIVFGLLPTRHFNGSELVFSQLLKPFYLHVKEHSSQKIEEIRKALDTPKQPTEPEPQSQPQPEPEKAKSADSKDKDKQPVEKTPQGDKQSQSPPETKLKDQ